MFCQAAGTFQINYRSFCWGYFDEVWRKWKLHLHRVLCFHLWTYEHCCCCRCCCCCCSVGDWLVDDTVTPWPLLTRQNKWFSLPLFFLVYTVSLVQLINESIIRRAAHERWFNRHSRLQLSRTLLIEKTRSLNMTCPSVSISLRPFARLLGIQWPFDLIPITLSLIHVKIV